jgi:hypothetical protein
MRTNHGSDARRGATRLTGYLPSLVFFAALFAIGALDSARGFDLSDEGMYAATALRYTLGDLPFRDEIYTANHSADILLSLVFRVCPEISLRELRLLGNGVNALAMALTFSFLSRYAPPLLVALLCLIYFLFNDFLGIATPSYNSLSSDFTLVAAILWLLSMAARGKTLRLSLAILAGTLLGMATISYLTIALAVAGPVIFILGSRYMSDEIVPDGDTEPIVATLAFIATFAIVMLAALVALVILGILPDFISANLATLHTYELGAKGPAVKLLNSSRALSPHLPYGLVTIGLFFAALLLTPARWSRRGVMGMIVIVAIFLLWLYTMSPAQHSAPRDAKIAFISLTLSLAVATAFVREAPSHHGPAGWTFVRIVFLGWGWLLSFIYAISSSSGSSAIMGLAPLFLISMLSLYGYIRGRSGYAGPDHPRTYLWPALYGALVVALLTEGAIYYRRSVYRESDPARQTVLFTHPKVAGISSTPEKVHATEALLSYLSSRVRPGDFLLAYHEIPGIYFLTSTRPAYAAAWARDVLRLEYRESLLRKMVDAGRLPEYSVRMLVADDWKTPLPYDPKSPLDLFVKQHYRLERTIYPFEIWRLTKESAEQPGAREVG